MICTFYFKVFVIIRIGLSLLTKIIKLYFFHPFLLEVMVEIITLKIQNLFQRQISVNFYLLN